MLVEKQLKHILSKNHGTSSCTSRGGGGGRGVFNFNLFEYEENKKIRDFVNSIFNFGVVSVTSKATGVT